MKKKFNLRKLLRDMKEGEKINVSFKHKGKYINERSLRETARIVKCSVEKLIDEEVFIITKKQN